MTELIGIKGLIFQTKDLNDLKRDLMFFDKIGLLKIVNQQNDKIPVNKNIDFFRGELDWLIEKNLIMEFPFMENLETMDKSEMVLGKDYVDNMMYGTTQFLELIFNFIISPQIKQALNEKDVRDRVLIEMKKSGNSKFKFSDLSKSLKKIEELFAKEIIPKLEQLGYRAPIRLNDNQLENFLIESTLTGIDFIIRAESIRLQKANNINAVPILLNNKSFQYSSNFQSNRNFKKSQVCQIVLKSLPVLDDSVAWEQILDFKRDSDSSSKLIELRNWISEIARGELEEFEIEEKLAYLLDRFEKQLKLHRLKYRRGVLETIITTTAEVAENIVKLKLGKLSQLPFSIKNKKISLMEEEIKAEGHEVAYILKAMEKFS